MNVHLQQPDACFFAGLHGSNVPHAGLDLADMGAAHHQHSQTGLTDAAADGQRQFVSAYPAFYKFFTY